MTNINTKLTPEAHKYLRIYCALNNINREQGLNDLIIEIAKRCPDLFMPKLGK